MHSHHIVLVDDELPNLESLERILRSENTRVSCFQDPQKALSFIQTTPTDVVVSDFRMTSFNGLELLESIKVLDPTIEVILVTAYGTVDLAVDAMKKGAYDFITKPLQRLAVTRVVGKALEKRRLAAENASLRAELLEKRSKGRQILGASLALKSMMEVASQAARSEANVLIEGESGTGKGLLAEYLHCNSDRRHGIFVKINCAAIPENLLEAELFGYEPGAFTGATKRKKGRIELSHEGTLFLDEIGIAPTTLQSKLLRFLQEGEFERLGSNETIRVNTRVISGTNANLKAAIQNGQLREDLFYRLNVIHIRVPPLRERHEDIEILSKRFLEDSARKNGRSVPTMHPEAQEKLLRYRWPGNIRELQNLMERLVVLNTSGTIYPGDLPQEISGCEKQKAVTIAIGTSLKEAEHRLMEETLRVTRGDKRLAAKLLGIHQRTVYRYLEEKNEVQLPPAPEEVPEKVSNG